VIIIEKENTVLLELGVWSHLTELARLDCWPCHSIAKTKISKSHKQQSNTNNAVKK